MEANQDTAVLAYIRHVLDHMQISPSALAKLAGVSSTTLTRPLNKTGYKFNLSGTTLEKIAQVSGINPGPFFANKDYVSTSLASYFDPEIYSSAIAGHPQTDHKSVVLVGYAGLGLWHEISMLHSNFIGAVDVAPINYKAADCFGLLIRDMHVGELAYPDDILICVKTESYRHELSAGTTVILERRKEGGRLIEMTVRKLQPIKAGWQLSTLGRQKPYLDQFVMSDIKGDEGAAVVGVVLCSVRYPN